MPTQSLKNLADQAGKSLESAEKYWNEAKDDAKNKGLTGDRFWAYVMGITKKRLGLASNFISIKKIAQYLNLTL